MSSRFAVVTLSSLLVLASAAFAGTSYESLRLANTGFTLDRSALESLPVPAAPSPAPVQAAPDRTAQPDWNVTPGKLCTPDDTNFKEYRYPEHIPYCNRHVTREMKLQVATDYGGIPQSEWPKYEFDHLIPLGIGGNSSTDNLWPQPRGDEESDGKDKLENTLYKQLSAGAITQAEAVNQTYAWFKKYIARHPELPVPLKTAIIRRLTPR